MAITLSEANKFTTNMVKKGVLEEIIKDSVILQRLPFIDVVGNAYQYLRENTLPTASYFDPNEIWTEDTGDYTQKTATIRILGGDADVDNFLSKTRSDKTDLTATTIAKKTKAVKHTFLNSFWYGDNAVNSKEFDGVHKIAAETAGQNIHQGAGAAGAALDIKNLDLLQDKILDGKADVLVSNRNIRRRVNQYLRERTNVQLTKDNFGLPFMEWNGVNWYIDDFLTQTEVIAGGAYSTKTGGATGTVFAIRFGSDDLLGLQNGGLEVIKIGQLESKDAKRTRIRWYVGMALMRSISLATIDGITDAAVVNA